METAMKKPVVSVPSIEISSGSPPLKTAENQDNGYPGKRASTLTDEDSEYENDKTPLIHTFGQHHHHQQQQHKSEQVSNNTVIKPDVTNQVVVVKIKTTSPGGSPRGPDADETSM